MGELVPLQQRRLMAREAIGIPGRIECEGQPSLRCSVVDISMQGASVWVPSASLPDVFTLKTVGAVRHVCETVWRKGEMVGARFVAHDQFSSPFALHEITEVAAVFGRRQTAP